MNIQTKPVAASRASTVQKVRGPRSGVEAWLVEDYAVPLVAFDFAFRGGGAQDSKDKAGAVSMLAALLDEGAGHLDADAFHRALDDKAVEISFSADRDHMQGRAKTLTRHLDAAAELLRLAVCEPRLDADAIERVRSQMIAGLKRESQDPDAQAGKAWREAAFPNHPYGMPGRGTLESVPAITRDDLVALRAGQMARDGLKIAVVGAVNAEKLSEILDHVFSGLAEKGALKKIPDVAMAGGGERRVIDVDVPQSTIRFSLPGIDRHDTDYWPAVVLNHIFGGGSFSARLFKEVREKRGLAYSVHSQLAVFDHAAVFSGGTSTKNERAAESLQVIEEEIAKMLSDGPTDEELVKARKYLIGSYALQFDTSTKIAGNLVHLQCVGHPVEFLDKRNDLIAAVTMDDLRRVAKRLFGGKKLLVAAAGRPTGM
jgi:zinc protease